MRVTTPIADMEVTVERLYVDKDGLVMTNSKFDAMPTRTVMGPRDVRKIFGAIFRPSIAWFALTCLFRNDAPVSNAQSSDEDHPTPNPW